MSLREKNGRFCGYYTAENIDLYLPFQQPDLLKEKLSENEKLMKEMSLTWEEKLHKTGKKFFVQLGVCVCVYGCM